MTAYLLNIFDLFCTLYAVNHGGVELNPLMAHPSIMVAYKVIVVGVLCWWLSHIGARKGLRLCAAVYAVLGLWHIYNLVEVFI